MHFDFSPHWRVGFLFLVLYPLRPPPRPPALTHSLTHPPTHSLTHSLSLSLSLTHSLIHSPTHSPTHLTHLPPSLTHSPTSFTHITHSLTSHHITSLTHPHHSLTSLTPSLPPTHPPAHPPTSLTSLTQLNSTHLTSPHSLIPLTSLIHSLLRGRRRTMCTAKGSDVRPGVPWVFASFAWQAWDNVHCQGVGCTPWRPLALRLFCVAGVGQCALPRGRMYALASLGSPRLLRSRRGLTHSLSHSLTHSFHSHHSLTRSHTNSFHSHHSFTRFCVAGVGQCALPRGRMYALASLESSPLLRGRRGTMCIAKGSDVRPGVPWVSASFAWQAWDNVHCQGVGCTPWRPLGLRLFCVAGVGQCALPRGRMYALASLGSPPLLRGRRGTMCTAKGSDVRPGVPWVSASFAWQAWDNVHCQGVGCTPWHPLGLRLFCLAGVGQCALPRGRMYTLASLGSPRLLHGRRGAMCTAKGSDVRPGVPWVSASFVWQARDNVHCQGVGCTPSRPLGLRVFCVAGVGQCALPRGRMYALASLGSPPLLRGRRGTMCTAKGSDVRLASLGSPPFLRGRRGAMCTAKGSDVRPGVPWLSASFAWQAWDNVRCQGVGCTPWRPLGLRVFCVAGVDSLTHPPSLNHPLTHSLTHARTHSPHSHSHSLTCACTYIHTHRHTHTKKNSPTITPPSLLYFLFPSCFSMLSLSLEKLVTCGVIRSFNFDLTILQHKLGRAALACRKTVAAPGGGRKQNSFQRSRWKWPVLHGSPTQHYTLHYTQHYTLHCMQHYRTAGRGGILELWCF